jgi:ammonia channel protein AmtB
MTLGKHIAIVLILIPCVILSTYLCLLVTNAIVPLRVTAEVEHVGLDRTIHGEMYKQGSTFSQNKKQEA